MVSLGLKNCVDFNVSWFQTKLIAWMSFLDQLTSLQLSEPLELQVILKSNDHGLQEN